MPHGDAPILEILGDCIAAIDRVTQRLHEIQTELIRARGQQSRRVTETDD